MYKSPFERLVNFVKEKAIDGKTLREYNVKAC